MTVVLLQAPRYSFLIIGIVFLVAFSRCFTFIVSPTSGEFRFHERGANVRWSPRHSSPVELRIAYSSIQHIETRGGTVIRLVFDTTDRVRGHAIEIPLNLAVAEDLFDRIVQHVEQQEPGHRFSVADPEHLHHSITWTWTELFDWQEPTDFAQLVPELKGRPVSAPSVCKTRHHSFTLSRDSGPGIGVHLGGGNSRELLRLHAGRAMDSRGMVLAASVRARGPVRIESGCGRTIDFHPARRTVVIDGENHGRLLVDPMGLRLELSESIPEVLAVCTLLLVTEHDLLELS